MLATGDRLEHEAMILHSEYPCLGARSVIRRVNATWVLLRATDEDDLKQLHQALTAFGQETEDSEEFVSCIAVFADPVDGGEAGFERSLWSVLQHLHLHDQFERLREKGAFDRMRETIRARDVRVQGDINPMVDDHGSRYALFTWNSIGVIDQPSMVHITQEVGQPTTVIPSNLRPWPVLRKDANGHPVPTLQHLLNGHGASGRPPGAT